MDTTISRRGLLGAGVVAATLPLTNSAQAATPKKARYRFCFNTSTIRGQKLPIDQVVDLAAKAGYDAIEPWINELDAFVKQGGSLSDLGKRIADHHLTVESAIGFANWIVDDDAAREKGLQEAKRNLEMLQQIGGRRLAAPPAGATNQPGLNLLHAADRYRQLLELAQPFGIVPQVEVWGFSKNLSRLGETLLVAVESRHATACILPDVYHLYKGGSDFSGLRLLQRTAFQVFHVNDYPENPPRATINDSHRVYPGDGRAPWKEIFGHLEAMGFDGALSLELFNPEYWKQDPLTVARTGLAKMKDIVARHTT